MDLLQIAKALGADDISSPTIPFVKPSGGITPYPTDITGASISLKTDVVRLKKDEKAIVKVVVFSDGKEVKSFKLNIVYNPTLFKITDADTTKTGVQIDYVNTFFEEKVNKVDETSGIIELSVESTGSATITNREIALFEVKALKDGVGEFKLIKSESEMIDISSVDILAGVNSISITIGDQYVTPSPSQVVPSYETPKTALEADSFSAIILGLVFIATGYYLYRSRNKHDLQR